MGGAGVSKSRSLPRTRSGVSRLCADIDERVGAFLERRIEGRIEGRWPSLWLDATCLKVREDGRIVSRAVMVAVAVQRTAGARCWAQPRPLGGGGLSRTKFLRGLAERGLRGVKLVIADDHEGLRAAAGRVAGRDVPEMPRPLGQERLGPCRDQAPWGGLRDAQDHPRSRQSKAAAVKQRDEAACALRARHAKLGEMMGASREDVLAHMDFPREHWPQIASTDEIDKRLLDPGGMVFPRGRPRGEARRVGCKRRRVPHSSLAGLRRSRTVAFGGRAFHRSTKRS